MASDPILRRSPTIRYAIPNIVEHQSALISIEQSPSAPMSSRTGGGRPGRMTAMATAVFGGAKHATPRLVLVRFKSKA
jgi:hypothetical protein